MKKLFLLLGLVVATGSVLAITPPKNSKQTTGIPSIKQLTTPPIYIKDLNINQKSIESPSAVTYQRITTPENSIFNLTNRDVSPIAYDPLTKSYWVASMTRVFNTNNTFAGSRGSIHRLRNGNVLWDSITVLHEPNVRGVFYPSIGIINPTKSTDINGVMAFYGGQLYKNQGSWSTVGGYFNVASYNPTAPYLDNLLFDEEFTVTVPNDLQTSQNWSITTMIGTESQSAKSGLFAAGLLDPNPNQQFGYYGFFGINEDGSEFVNSIPRAWDITKFLPSTAIGSTFQTPPHLDTDLLGNVYMAANNVPPGSDLANEINARRPFVSKSTDYGNTWTEFNICSKDAFKEYAVLNGATELVINQSPFDNINGFVVYGDDKYSFFTRAQLFNDNGAGGLTAGAIGIYEINFENNKWSVYKVTDLNSTNFSVLQYNNSLTQANVPQVGPIFQLVTHRLGNEIQASKTADGQHIVLKWIDANPNLIDIISPPNSTNIRVLQENLQTGQDEFVALVVDTVDVTDVFASSRPVNSKQWSNKVNVTNDKVFNHSTFMPKIVESLDKIAFISARVGEFTTSTNPVLRLPSLVNRITLGINYILSYSTFNLQTVSAGNEKPMEVTINNVYPSIASNQASIEFVSPVEVTTSIEITNINGEVVKTIFNGVSNVGQNLVGFTVNDMPNGVYFVTVKTGGNVQTSKFTVLK